MPVHADVDGDVVWWVEHVFRWRDADADVHRHVQRWVDETADGVAELYAAETDAAAGADDCGYDVRSVDAVHGPGDADADLNGPLL